ncbi:MAG: hypothetical protein Q9225_002056 [Loekoesia sp. 1 TL-2023]
MPFQVLPCDYQDLPTCCSIHWSAYASNPLWQKHFPNGGTPDLQRWTTYHMQCEFENPDIHFNKVVDSSDMDKEIIGCTKWTVENGDIVTNKDNTMQNSERDEERSIGNSPFHPPDVPEEDSKEANFSQWMSQVIEIRHKHLDRKRTIVLDDLSVLPDHQRHGAGTLLLKSLVDFADERALPCYLESTPLAYTMYTRQGFRNFDMVEIDLGKGKEGYEPYKAAMMYREAPITLGRERESSPD